TPAVDDERPGDHPRSACHDFHGHGHLTENHVRRGEAAIFRDGGRQGRGGAEAVCEGMKPWTRITRPSEETLKLCALRKYGPMPSAQKLTATKFIRPFPKKKCVHSRSNTESCCLPNIGDSWCMSATGALGQNMAFSS